MHIDCLQAYGDSQLAVRQLNGQYAVRNATLVPYHERVKYLTSQFQDIHVSHIPRSENDKADALANLAASLTLPSERDIQVTVGERYLLSPAIERTRPDFPKTRDEPFGIPDITPMPGPLTIDRDLCRKFGRVSPINWTFPKIHTCIKTQFIFPTGSMHNIISCNSHKWPSAFP
ncbi:hypothetical protein L3X38_003582 [Prunus dulcis]|uniref:RNase H type-1 domain-containing protein n=1 Tax=Prunus dulcis TaxID=3755 RepID=A0AAD4ZMC0_PRUDU|nr:hypothetical protein L3X38_003582 [Prunus dulcis]